MFCDNIKLHYYDILNSIKMDYMKIKEPFDFGNNNIILTHKIIKLKYLTDKNYFVKVDKKNKNDNHNQNNNHKRSESKNKPKFTPEEHAAYLERKKRREQNKHGGKKILVFC